MGYVIVHKAAGWVTRRVIMYVVYITGSWDGLQPMIPPVRTIPV